MIGAAIGRAISSATLRDLVRSKLRAGATKDAINLLILDYIPPEATTDRVERGIPRHSLESIPRDRRADFLTALQEISIPQETFEEIAARIERKLSPAGAG
jgi:hypothetical protein